jgi:hypothetical protein
VRTIFNAAVPHVVDVGILCRSWPRARQTRRMRVVRRRAKCAAASRGDPDGDLADLPSSGAAFPSEGKTGSLGRRYQAGEHGLEHDNSDSRAVGP